MSVRSFMVCDHEECNATHPYKWPIKLIGTGWTGTNWDKRNVPHEHYCPKHSTERFAKCDGCNRPMRPRSRSLKEFPDSVARGEREGLCSGCGHTTMKKREIMLENALEHFWTMRPELKPYRDDHNRAVKFLERNDALDVRELIGV